MTDESDSPDGYRVGKGRPPRSTQFKPGQVANPDGRRGKKGLATSPPSLKEAMGRIFRDILTSKVDVNTPKGRQRLTMMEVLLRQLITRAGKSDRAMGELRKWQVEFPVLISPTIQVRKIEMEVLHPNPFKMETATIGKFRDTFPDAPQEHLDILRKYFKEGYSMNLDD